VKVEFENEEFEAIVSIFLKQAISEVNTDFGSSIIMDKEKNILSVLRIGEFEFSKAILENYEKGGLISIANEMKPFIRNRGKREAILSFKKRKIESELIFPIKLRDERTILFVLPSFKKGYFKEEQIEKIEKIAEEMSLAVEKNLKKVFVFYKGEIFKETLEDFFREGFRFISNFGINQKSQEFKNAEFLFLECPLKCSINCNKYFKICKNLKIPMAILRPIEFKASGKTIPIFSFYFQNFLNKNQKRIVEIAEEMEKRLSLELFRRETWLYEKIYFIRKNLANEWFSNSNVNDICKSLKISRVYFSNCFRKITGKSVKEFIDQLRICESLYLLSLGRTISSVSYLVGYRERSSFFKKFVKTFGAKPKLTKKL